MIGTLLRIGWINFRRDRAVQALTLVVPIVFFSIFATVFANQRNATRKVQVAIADEDQSPYSTKLADALAAEGGLSVRRTADETGAGAPLDRATAERLVRNGDVPVAIVLPKGLGAAPRLGFQAGGAAPTTPTIDLLADVSDPVAPQVVQGLLQKASFIAAPKQLAVEGLSMFEKYSGPLTPAQKASFSQWVERPDDAPLSASSSGSPAGSSTTGSPASTQASPGIGGLALPTRIVNVLQPGQGNGATISFYAAGLGVMFLLFSSAGAGGSLLDEEEAGTLGRLIGSRAGMSGVLLGKWLFLCLTGIGQLCAMFLWGAAVFHLPLFSHVPGFLIMTVCTAAAASGFGLVLATISRSRQQLQALSTIVILTMSALGGSMFPRFLMSDTMRQVGLATFNAWALDGYLKVFWRNAPLLDLWPQVLVLGGLSAFFLLVARRLARRWETL